MSSLKAAFHDNPRCVALVNAFSEGVALHAVGSGDRMSVAVNQQSNGYELLRQLTWSSRSGHGRRPCHLGPRSQEGRLFWLQLRHLKVLW